MERLNEITSALENLSEVSDEELSNFTTELREMYKELRAGEVSDKVVADCKTIADTLSAIKVEDEKRTEAADALAAQLADLDATVAVDDAEPEADEADEDESEDEAPAEDAEPEAEATEEVITEAELEPVLASTAQAAARLNKANKSKPRVTVKSEPSDRLFEIAKVANDKWFSSSGDGNRVNVARIARDLGSDRKLDGNLDQNIAKMNKVMSPDAIVASGGVCAPATPLYDLSLVSGAQRPVRDSLPSFNADRGGVTTIASPTLASVGTSGGGSSQAVDVITNAEDVSDTTKPYQKIACPSTTTTRVEAITDQFQFGELQSRYHPELVAQWLGLGLAAHARTAENELLTTIGTGSTAITEQLVFGASRDVPRYMNREAAQIRNRHRMPWNAPIRVMLPAWFVRMYQDDVIASTNPVLLETNPSLQSLTAVLASMNIVATFFDDGVGTGPQIAAAQPVGPLNGWGSVLRWYMFPEGTWLFLDGGELAIDVIRDSTLVAGNNFRTFYESFENVVNVGVESHVVTATVCESGLASGVISPSLASPAGCTEGS